MARNSQHGELSERFMKLVQERTAAAAMLERLDATLERISSVLGVENGAGVVRRGPGRPPGSGSTAKSAGVSTGSGKKRRRQRFAISGEDSVLGFLRENRNATTQDVKAHWKSEGRGGTADNALSKLYREGRVKRTPIEGKRGSKFTRCLSGDHYNHVVHSRTPNTGVRFFTR